MSFSFLQGQTVVPLYQNVPNSKPAADYRESSTGKGESLHIDRVSNPIMEIFVPQNQKENSAAVIICPGGGYRILAYNKEGVDVARVLNSWGVVAIVLKYRLPDDVIMEDKSIGPLQDAEQAILYVREHAARLRIDPNKIGIMGFSAGGHLASTLSTHYNEVYIDNPNRISLRPDFSVLVYPVISFRDDLTHRGSRENLIGKNPSEEMIHRFSNDEQVNEKTPPAFFVLANDDQSVLPENSIRYYEALRKSGIPTEMHIYRSGGHGFGLRNNWMDLLRPWMTGSGFLPN